MSPETMDAPSAAGYHRLSARLTDVVRADFQSLVASHHQPDLLGVLVCEETNVTSSPLFPFSGISVESEELSAPLRLQVG